MGGAKKAFITKANAANDLEGWGGPGAGQGRSDGINVPNKLRRLWRFTSICLGAPPTGVNRVNHAHRGRMIGRLIANSQNLV
jgi:hypothetical protein